MFGKYERRVVLALLILIFFLISLWVVQLVFGETGYESYNVSFLVREPSERVEQGAARAAIDYNIDLHLFTGAEDAERQMEIFDREVKSQVNGILIAPELPELLETFLQSNRVSMPVITLYTPIEAVYVEHIGLDNQKVGVALAEEVAQRFNKKPVLAVLDNASDTILARMEAFEETLRGKGISVERVDLRDVRAKLLDFAAYKGVNLVVLEESLLPEVQAHKRSDDRLFGCGFQLSMRDSLEAGEIEALVVWSDYDIGYLAVQRMAEKMRGKSGASPELGVYVATGQTMYEQPLAKILFPVG